MGTFLLPIRNVILEMRRRDVLNIGSGFLFTLSGCSALSKDEQCHCGHHGPPKGIYIKNPSEETRSMTIDVYPIESDESVFSTELTLQAGSRESLDEIITKEGEYEISITTSDESRRWQTTTEKCSAFFFMLQFRSGGIHKSAVPCS